MNCLITGHKGLIGHFLKKRLENEGYKIVKGVDIRDGNDILELKDEKTTTPIDIVFHLAAHCKINEAVKNPENSHINDANGTFSVLEFCRKNNIQKIVYFSSSRVLSPEKNPYTAAKIYGEELCRAYKDCYNIDYIIIRPSTVYGPFDDKTHRLIDIFIRSALNDENLKIFGNPSTKTLDFTYIDDFVDAVMLSLNSTWNTDYDISGEEESFVKDLAEMIIKKTNSKSKIIITNQEIAQPQEVKLDITKLKNIGYKPKVSLENGVEKCINFYKKLQ